MKYFKFLFLFAVLSLSGCGGDSSSGTDGNVVQPPTQQESFVKAMDFSISAPLIGSGEPQTIFLKPYVLSDIDSQIFLSDVEVLTRDCEVSDAKSEAISFSYVTRDIGLCLFKYTVTDKISQEQSSGVASILTKLVTVGPKFDVLPEDSQLNDINKSAQLGDTILIELHSEESVLDDLNEMVHPLFSESTITHGDGFASLTEAGYMSYKAVTVGATEVTYFVLDDKNTIDKDDDEVFIGHVQISVSGSTNTAPIANDGHYPNTLAYNSSVEIDVTNFPGIDSSLISDTDGSDESLQLVAVRGSGVFAELSAPNDVTNTKFIVYTPAAPTGEASDNASVYYTIYDHNEDGAAAGKIEFSIGKTLVSCFVAPSDNVTSGVSNVQVAIGNHQGFVAVGTYDDDTQAIITNRVSWNSSEEGVATLDSTGVAEGVSNGHSNISASVRKLDDSSLTCANTIDLEVTDAVLTSFWITPPLKVMPLGTTTGIRAIGLYSDGTTASISRDVTWSTDEEPPVVEIDNSVVGTEHPNADMTALNIGIAKVSAEIDGLVSKNKATVKVTAATVSSLQLTPTPVRLAKGEKQAFEVRANFTDGTNSDVTNDPLISYSASDSSIASFTDPMNPSIIEGVDVGHAIVTATYHDIVSNEADVFVSDAKVKAVQVTPPFVNIPKGTRAKLDALATYTDGSQRHVSLLSSWHVQNTDIATVNFGLVYGSNTGHTIVTATYDGVESNRVYINIKDAVLKEVAITSSDPTAIPAGLSSQLEAIAKYSDNSTITITDIAAWSVAEPSLISITSPGGVATAAPSADVGAETTATVTWDGLSDTITLQVSDGVVTDIVVSPSSASIPAGRTQNYTAEAVFSDGHRDDITDDPSTHWQSSDTSIAIIDVSALATGLESSESPIVIRATNDNYESLE